MSIVKDNRKIAIPGLGGGFKLRVYRSKATAQKMARIRVKCGCCNESILIAYDHQTLEIGPVIGSVEEWKNVLEPLLYPDSYQALK